MTITRRGLMAAGGAALVLPLPRAFAAPAMIDLGYRSPYRINVASIEVIDRYEPPFTSPNVEHHFAEPPARLAQRWANTRLIPTGQGTERTGRFTIDIASVIDVDLPKEGGLTGLFTKQQDRRYDARLAVSLEIITFGGVSESKITASATATQTMPEKASLEDRDAVFLQLSRNLIVSLEQEFDKLMPMYLSAYLR